MTTISNMFNNSLAGWTIDGDATFAWQPNGGHPSGCAHWVDQATGPDAYYVASSGYLGNKSSYFRGTISYDIKDTGNTETGVPDIELTGDGITLVHVAGQPKSGDAWTHFSANLTAAGWRVGSHDSPVAGDPAATVAQMKDVLAHLTSVEIRAEYVDGAENGSLDNVIMSTPAAARTAHSELAQRLFDAALQHSVDRSQTSPHHETMFGALSAHHGRG